MQMSQALIYDGCAWLGNVSTSVLIVFVNKALMDPQKGYRFTFGASQLNNDPCIQSSLIHVLGNSRN